MGDLYGTSIDTKDPRFGKLTDDGAIVRQRAVLALKTERGSVRKFPDYGFDLDGHVGKGLSADDLARLPEEVRLALKEEPSFASTDVEVLRYTPTPGGGCEVELGINIKPATGDRVGFTIAAGGGAGVRVTG